MSLGEVARSVLSALGKADPAMPERFADRFREFGGYRNLVLTGSGRAGFRLLLQCLQFPPGSEIIFPAYTFHVMPQVAAECGLKPVFADVDPGTWNITPQSIRARLTDRTKAVVPTHLFGVPADMEKISDIARSRNLFVIEDCAHALGAVYRGRPVGNFGDASLFTFAMSKNMPSWGGGAMVVKDDDLAARMKSRIDTVKLPAPLTLLRRQLSNIPGIIFTQPLFFSWTLYPAIRLADILGSDYFDRPFFESIAPPRTREGAGERGRTVIHKTGITGISPFQASTGLRQLSRFPGWLEKQAENARRLRALLENCPALQLQEEPAGSRSSFLYVRARVDDPGRIRRKLLRVGIDTKPDDMRDCSSLEIFEDSVFAPAAARLGGHCIELPCSHFYSFRQIDGIAGRIHKALTKLN